MHHTHDRRSHQWAGRVAGPRALAGRAYKTLFGGGKSTPIAPLPPVDDTAARRRAEELRLARRRRSGFSGAVLTSGLDASGDGSAVAKKKLLGE